MSESLGEQSPGELDFSDGEGDKQPRKSKAVKKPKIQLVKVLNTDKYGRHFVAPDGKRCIPGNVCWVTENQAKALVKRDMVEVLEREDF